MERFQNFIISMNKKNQVLYDMIDNLEHNEIPQQIKNQMINEFQNVIKNHRRSLTRRLNRLTELEEEIKVFRFDEKQQQPPKIVYPPINKTIHSPRAGLKTSPRHELAKLNAKSENDHLTEKALYLERLIVIQKMKLKLCHDHRDLALLSNEFDIAKERIKNYSDKNHEEEEQDDNIFELDDDVDQKLKTNIKNIKAAIEHEKKRIKAYESKFYNFYDAASKIQKVWLGYNCRRKLKSGMVDKESSAHPDTENNNQENEASDSQDVNHDNEQQQNSEENENAQPSQIDSFDEPPPEESNEYQTEQLPQEAASEQQESPPEQQEEQPSQEEQEAQLSHEEEQEAQLSHEEEQEARLSHEEQQEARLSHEGQQEAQLSHEEQQEPPSQTDQQPAQETQDEQQAQEDSPASEG